MSERRAFVTVSAYADYHGITDAELARRIGCSRSQATKLRGGRRYRSLAQPLRVARVCGVPIEHLVEAPVRNRHNLR